MCKLLIHSSLYQILMPSIAWQLPSMHLETQTLLQAPASSYRWSTLFCLLIPPMTLNELWTGLTLNLPFKAFSSLLSMWLFTPLLKYNPEWFFPILLILISPPLHKQARGKYCPFYFYSIPQTHALIYLQQDHSHSSSHHLMSS